MSRRKYSIIEVLTRHNGGQFVDGIAVGLPGLPIHLAAV